MVPGLIDLNAWWERRKLSGGQSSGHSAKARQQMPGPGNGRLSMLWKNPGGRHAEHPGGEQLPVPLPKPGCFRPMFPVSSGRVRQTKPIDHW